MKCSECPALKCSCDMCGEYSSWCELGYEQIEYKNGDGQCYCRKSLSKIKSELEQVC